MAEPVDTINYRDLPVPGKPKQCVARTVTVMERGDPFDPAVEALLLVRREPILVIDFYRSRPGGVR